MAQFVMTRKNMAEKISEANADALKDIFQKAGTVTFVLLTHGGSMIVAADNKEEVKRVVGDDYQVFVSNTSYKLA